jgi:hypothetical protein
VFVFAFMLVCACVGVWVCVCVAVFGSVSTSVCLTSVFSERIMCVQPCM